MGDLYAEAGSGGARLLVMAGRPLGEPVAWRGPIVMTSDEELALAFRELREGTFIRKPAKEETPGAETPRYHCHRKIS